MMTKELVSTPDTAKWEAALKRARNAGMFTDRKTGTTMGDNISGIVNDVLGVDETYTDAKCAYIFTELIKKYCPQREALLLLGVSGLMDLTRSERYANSRRGYLNHKYLEYYVSREALRKREDKDIKNMVRGMMVDYESGELQKYIRSLLHEDVGFIASSRRSIFDINYNPEEAIVGQKDYTRKPEIFFIADTHFSSEDIIRYENRPFENTRVMDGTMIRNWNEVVSPDDIVYHLGDFGAEGHENEFLHWLNGTIYLVKGNHDVETNEYYRDVGFKEVYDLPVVYDGYWLLSHEPMYVNTNMPYANLFGHVHANPIIKDSSPYHVCVSVERTDYAPISLSEIKRRIKDSSI